MTKQEFLKRCETGSPLIAVEYRSGTCERIAWRDKVTGRAQEMISIAHNVECGSMAMRVTERVDDGMVKPEAWVSPYKKGSICALHLSGMVRDKGAVKASGELETITT